MVSKTKTGVYLAILVVIILGLTAGMVYFGVSRGNDLEKMESMSQKLKEYEDTVSAKDSQLNDLQSRVDEQEQKIEEYESTISNLEIQLAAKKNGAIPGKVAYLTFDDGPSPNTIKILDVLKERGVKATFFVVNSSYNHYMKRIVEDGHCIGLHAYRHDYRAIYQSTDAYFEDLYKIQKVVKDLTGVESKVLRFPGGGSNTVSKFNKGIMTKLTKMVQEKGFSYFDWNVDSGDADANRVPTATLVSNVKNRCKGKDKINILMHDAGAKTTTVEALPAIIDYLKGEGYTFLPLSNNAFPVHHHVNN